MGCNSPGSSVHGLSRQEYWSGLLRPPPEGLPDPGIEPASLTLPALAGGFFSMSATWEALSQLEKESALNTAPSRSGLPTLTPICFSPCDKPTPRSTKNVLGHPPGNPPDSCSPCPKSVNQDIPKAALWQTILGPFFQILSPTPPVFMQMVLIHHWITSHQDCMQLQNQLNSAPQSG